MFGDVNMNYFIDQIPSYVYGCIAGAATSIITLTMLSLKFLLGQIPNPSEANEWSFYGILIIAIVALSLFILALLRWGATVVLDCINKNTEAMSKISNSIDKVNSSLSKQEEFFEGLGVDLIRHSLSEVKEKNKQK
jgi:hypothetical protein